MDELNSIFFVALTEGLNAIKLLNHLELICAYGILL